MRMGFRSLIGIVFLVLSAHAQELRQSLSQDPQQGLLWGKVKSMSKNLARFQKSAPLQVVGATSANMDMLEAVHLINVSDRTIVKYTLGWVITDEAGDGEGRPFLGLPTESVIKPLAVEVAGRQGASFKGVLRELNLRGIAKGLVVVGVVSVRFADGGEWSHPLLKRRKFESESDPDVLRALDQRMGPTRDQYRQRMMASEPNPVLLGRASASGACSTPSPSAQPATNLSDRVIGWAKGLFSLPTVQACSGTCYYIWVCNPMPVAWCQIYPTLHACSTWSCGLGDRCPHMGCALIPQGCN